MFLTIKSKYLFVDTRRQITALQKVLDAMHKRNLELTALFKRLFEDNVLGRIPDEHYRTLSNEYTDLTELTPELPRMFIAKVVVGEKAEKYSRTASQDIWIHYSDVGMLNDVKKEFDIPSMEEFLRMDDETTFDDELPAAI